MDISRSSSPEEPLIQIAEARLKATEKQFAQPWRRVETPLAQNDLTGTQIEQLTSENAKLHTKIAHHTKDYDLLQQQRDYVRNAYGGLKRKHNQLSAERANETGRMNGLQHDLEVSNERFAIERARRERAERQAGAIGAELTRFRTEMVEYLREGQNILRKIAQ
jgi:chromosome segregation ATPase